jgi:hypothetical protein
MVLSKNKRGGSRKMNTATRGGSRKMNNKRGGSKMNTIKRGGNRKMNNKRGGSRKMNTTTRGGAVRMPLEYFGGNSNKYFASGDDALKDGSSAYGPFYSVSQGVASPDGQMFGPNVGPYPNSSCTQTGGRRRSKKSKRSRK